MGQNSILYPLFAQVILSFVVWCWMYYTRIRMMQINRVNASQLKTSMDEHRLLAEVLGPSENLVNLFELPVLFYAAVLLVYTSQLNSELLMGLAWTFVIFRCMHSLVHCTSNNVMQRFTLYVISSVSLWSMWAVIMSLII